NWTFAGPGPITGGQIPNDGIVSGRITAIVASPTDPNKIYVGAAGGGIWKTTDGGANWLPLTDFQANTAVGSMALAPTNPSIIYVGTGEANNSRDSQYGRGVLKSIAGGATWTLLGNTIFNRSAIRQIVVDPTNANIVYATVAGTIVNSVTGNRGVWKSTDGGVNWTKTTATITSAVNFSDLVIDPSDPQTLYCAVGESTGNVANGIYK